MRAPRRFQLSRTPTPSEVRVINLLAKGYTVAEAAEWLDVSDKTVEAHKYNVMKRMGLHTTGQMIAWAIAGGYIDVIEVLREAKV